MNTKLIMNIKRLMQLIVLLFAFVSCVKEDASDEMTENVPVVVTSDVAYITATSAKLGVRVEGKGYKITARGVRWSTSPNPTIDDRGLSYGNGGGEFTAAINGLTDGTTYYVRAYATYAKGTVYSEEKSFTTVSQTMPQIATINVTSITASSAVCGGNVTSDGGANVTARGVCWSTSPNPTISNSKTTNGTGTGSFISNITGLTDNTTYYVRAYATNSKGTAYGEERSFTTTPSAGTLAGHDWIDLGLPSGLKWATCNVGATTPEDYGNYYAWGETITKSEYTEENSVTMGQPMSDFSGNVTYDVATANWGSTWRMPTKAEMQELVNNCTWTWTTQSSVNGCRVTGPNGNSIFLPSAGYCGRSSLCYVGEFGYYWSSTPYESDTNFACRLYFSSGNHYVRYNNRFIGYPVRPVSE